MCMDKLLKITSHVKLPWKEGGGYAGPIVQIAVGSKSEDARWSWHFRRTLLVVFGEIQRQWRSHGLAIGYSQQINICFLYKTQ